MPRPAAPTGSTVSTTRRSSHTSQSSLTATDHDAGGLSSPSATWSSAASSTNLRMDTRLADVLPVEDVVPELWAALGPDGPGTAVLTAEPGAGKTTIVPLRLLPAVDGRIVVLEPRRVATRAAARRMAGLIGEEVGATVGYVTRDERVTSADTRIEVVTEG